MSTFDCSQAEEVLSLQLDGGLDAATARRLDYHLKGCAACSANLASLKASLAALRAMPVPAIDDLPERVAQAIAKHTPPSATAPTAKLPVIAPVKAAQPAAKKAAAPTPVPPARLEDAHFRELSQLEGRASSSAPPRPPFSAFAAAHSFAGSRPARRATTVVASLMALALAGYVGYRLAPDAPAPETVLAQAGLERSASGWVPTAERQQRERGAVWVDGAWRDRDAALQALMALKGVVPQGGAWLDGEGWKKIAEGRVLAGNGWIDGREFAAGALRRDGLRSEGRSWLADEDRSGLMIDGKRVEPEAWLAERLTAAGYAKGEDQRWRPAGESRPLPVDADAVAQRWLESHGYVLTDGRWSDPVRNAPVVAVAGGSQVDEQTRIRIEQDRWGDVLVLPGTTEPKTLGAPVRGAVFNAIAAGVSGNNAWPKTFAPGQGLTGWRVSLGAPANVPLGTPALVSGRVHVGGGFSSTMVFAFDAATGKQGWAVALSDNGPSSPMPVGDDIAYATESCSLYSLNARSGRPTFGRYLASTIYAMPAAVERMTITSTPFAGGFALAAFDARGGNAWVSPLPADLRTAPLIVDDRLVCATRSGGLLAILHKDGTAAWRQSLGALSTPTIASGKLVLRRAVQLRDRPEVYGEVLTLVDANDGSFQQRMVGEPRSFAITSETDPTPVALPQGDGVVGLPDLGPAALTHGLVVAVRGDRLEAVEAATGRIAWTVTLGRSVAQRGSIFSHSDPSISGGLVVVGTLDGKVLGIDLATGATRWSAVVGSPIGNVANGGFTMFRVQPVVADGRVLVTTLSGELVCVDTGERSLQGPRWWGDRID